MHGSAKRSNRKEVYDGLLPTEMKRLKQLEDEISKLSRLVADLSLDKEMLQDVVRRNFEAWSETRAGGGDVREWNMSIRRTCRVLESTTRPAVTNLATAHWRPYYNEFCPNEAIRPTCPYLVAQ